MNRITSGSAATTSRAPCCRRARLRPGPALRAGGGGPVRLDDLQPRGGGAARGTVDVETGHPTSPRREGAGLPDAPSTSATTGSTAQEARQGRNDAAMAALVKDAGQTALWKEYGGGAGTTSSSKVLPRPRDDRFTEEVEALVERESGAAASTPPIGADLSSGTPARRGAGGRRRQLRHGLGGFHGNVETTDGRPVYYAVVVYSQRTSDGVNGIDFTGKPIDNVIHHREPRDHRSGHRPGPSGWRSRAATLGSSPGTTTPRRSSGETARRSSTTGAVRCAARARSGTSPSSTPSSRATRISARSGAASAASRSRPSGATATGRRTLAPEG